MSNGIRYEKPCDRPKPVFPPRKPNYKNQLVERGNYLFVMAGLNEGLSSREMVELENLRELLKSDETI